MVVGGPQSDYSVCPRPLRRVFNFSGFWFSGFQVGFWFLVFRVFGFSGFQVFGLKVFWTGRDAELNNIRR